MNKQLMKIIKSFLQILYVSFVFSTIAHGSDWSDKRSIYVRSMQQFCDNSGIRCKFSSSGKTFIVRISPNLLQDFSRDALPSIMAGWGELGGKKIHIYALNGYDLGSMDIPTMYFNNSEEQEETAREERRIKAEEQREEKRKKEEEQKELRKKSKQASLDRKTYFNKGISFYNDNNYDDALKQFKLAKMKDSDIIGKANDPDDLGLINNIQKTEIKIADITQKKKEEKSKEDIKTRTEYYLKGKRFYQTTNYEEALAQYNLALNMKHEILGALTDPTVEELNNAISLANGTFEQKQNLKGLIKYDGRWMTKTEKAQIEKNNYVLWKKGNDPLSRKSNFLSVNWFIKTDDDFHYSIGVLELCHGSIEDRVFAGLQLWKYLEFNEDQKIEKEKIFAQSYLPISVYLLPFSQRMVSEDKKISWINCFCMYLSYSSWASFYDENSTGAHMINSPALLMEYGMAYYYGSISMKIGNIVVDSKEQNIRYDKMFVSLGIEYGGFTTDDYTIEPEPFSFMGYTPTPKK
ncbi:MAG: hypothetical protein A2252_09665 [Elusimicrobia bacterium RIFOXYA2_FULL_39_19]|nr:MAG: hypothetical protein A2252_09665 [Elusimicrobia bacterium RIFOXYA2_FULL_39_19]